MIEACCWKGSRTLTRSVASIQADLATWEAWGIGGPKLTVEMIRGLVAGHIEQFIKDYSDINSKLRSTPSPLPDKALQPTAP